MIAALLMLAQIAPAPSEPEPIITTISAIRANPKKFDGQVVRLHGWVNKCEPLYCPLDERAAGSLDGTGAFLSVGANKKFDETLKPLVPSYVEVDARFSAACITGDICLDRAPVLTVVKLRAVVTETPPPEAQ